MKMDYVLRRRALLGISALFCSTLLLFGCQDTESPVGPELDSSVAAEEAGVSASAKPDCSPWPECKDDGDSGNGSTVEMLGGLVTTSDPPQVLDTFKENKRSIAGRMDVFNVLLNLIETRTHAKHLDTKPDDCSFTCDANLLDCNFVYDELLKSFVSPSIANHPTVATSGYDGLSVGFDKTALGGTASGNCPFTGIAAFEPPGDGGVLIQNCVVIAGYKPGSFTVVANSANTVSTGQRFETDGKEGLGPQDYRATLACPLQEGDEFTVTFASN